MQGDFFPSKIHCCRTMDQKEKIINGPLDRGGIYALYYMFSHQNFAQKTMHAMKMSIKTPKRDISVFRVRQFKRPAHQKTKLNSCQVTH